MNNNIGGLNYDRLLKLTKEIPHNLDRKIKKEPIPKKLRDEIVERDNYTCWVCGHEGKENGYGNPQWDILGFLHIHHIIPNGKATEDNLVTLCKDCHQIVHTLLYLDGKWKRVIMHSTKKRFQSDYIKQIAESALTEEQVKKLIHVVSHLNHEVLLLLAVSLGLRRDAIVAISLKDVDLKNNQLRLYEKGKERVLPLSLSLAIKLEQHIHTVKKKYRSKWLFPSSHNPEKHISSKTAWNTLNKYLLKANLPQRPFHALHATCIKLCQKKGWHIEQVMKLTNESFRNIKVYYDVPGEEEMLEIAKCKPLFE